MTGGQLDDLDRALLRLTPGQRAAFAEHIHRLGALMVDSAPGVSDVASAILDQVAAVERRLADAQAALVQGLVAGGGFVDDTPAD